MGEEFSGLSMGWGTEKSGAGPHFKSLVSDSQCPATTRLFLLFILYLTTSFPTKSSSLLPDKMLCFVLHVSIADYSL